jgi:hypothetical protein
MQDRCKPYHKSYEYYKDVAIDPKWLDSFEAFLEDMGERPEGMTLDRKDGKLGYNKDNCRWADASTQQQNKRVSQKNATGYPGVTFGNDRYTARIRHKSVKLYVGCFLTALQAALAYDKKGKELFGDEWKSYFTEEGQKR